MKSAGVRCTGTSRRFPFPSGYMIYISARSTRHQTATHKREISCLLLLRLPMNDTPWLRRIQVSTRLKGICWAIPRRSDAAQPVIPPTRQVLVKGRRNDNTEHQHIFPRNAYKLAHACPTRLATQAARHRNIPRNITLGSVVAFGNAKCAGSDLLLGVP